MKKIITAALSVLMLVLFAGCEEQKIMSGSVVLFSQDENGENQYFELDCGDENYCFIVTDDTELVWQDKTLLETYGISEDQADIDYFGGGMTASVVAGEECERPEDYSEECVEGCYIAEKIVVTGFDEYFFAVEEKPVIYLYPEKTTEVEVKLDYNGKIFCTYPKYEEKWLVTAHSDGTVTDENGQEYNYLYWEGINGVEYDFSQGFCIKGEDTAAFLEEALEKLGLSRREANEFIVFWLPQMEKNPYNLISFQTDVYTENARLEITPAPDTLIRVFMAFRPLEEKTDIPGQILSAPERSGFTVVEWGGAKVD